MDVAASKNGVPIRLTDERWNHIVERHPEMTDSKAEVLLSVAEPDLIQQGDFGELLAIRSWPDLPPLEKLMVVAYREVDNSDGFILTAYFARRVSRARRVIWTR